MSKRIETVECEEFSRSYGEIYAALYHNEDYINYRKAVDLFDHMIADDGFKSQVIAFAQFRNDYISSDRECAAFVMALKANEMY